MNKVIVLLFLFAVSSCSEKPDKGRYYTNSQWQKFRKEYDLGKLRERPVEIKEDEYTELDDTIINSSGKFKEYNLFRFYNTGDLSVWKSYKSDSEWVIAEMKYDENGLQSRYYSNRDSLKTFCDAGKVVSTRLKDGRFLLHSFFNIGPAFMLISFNGRGNIVKKEYIIDSFRLNDVLKTVTAYYKDDLLQKVDTKTKDGVEQTEIYYYSVNHKLDSACRLILNKLTQKEFFVNNQFGDPVSYVLQRVPKNDTIQYVTLKYVYDNHGNWVRRLENKIIGNYGADGKNPHHTLVKRGIKYAE